MSIHSNMGRAANVANPNIQSSQTLNVHKGGFETQQVLGACSRPEHTTTRWKHGPVTTDLCSAVEKGVMCALQGPTEHGDSLLIDRQLMSYGGASRHLLPRPEIEAGAQNKHRLYP